LLTTCSTARREGLDLFLAADAEIPGGPPNAVPTDIFSLIYPLLQAPFRSVTRLEGLNEYIAANFSSATPGGFFAGSSPTFAWKGNYQISYAIATQNLLDISLLQIPITSAFQPFDYPFLPTAGKSLQFTLYFGLAMSAYPGFFSLYTNVERLRNVRALHYSNGVRAGPLWVAYTLFDFLIVLLVSAAAIIAFTATTDVLYAPAYLFVVFMLYGLSATTMSYVVSLFTTSQLATFAFAAGGQCCMFLIYFVVYMVLLTYAPTADIDRDVNIANYTIALFFPAGNLLRALLLAFNQFSLLCRGTDQIASYPGAFDVYGGPILYLILQSVVFLTILIWYDSGYQPAFLARKKHRLQDVELTDEVDPEVFAEAKRVDSAHDELRVLHATKAFGPNIAVQDVTFGVPKGEVFALLGPNGAGKSTTIGLIRGDSRPSDKSSEILIEDTSILRHRAAARSHLGVCPQFDAVRLSHPLDILRHRLMTPFGFGRWTV